MTGREWVEAQIVSLAVTVAFVVFKVFGVTDWSWTWVPVLIWAPTYLVIAFYLFIELPLALIRAVDRFVRRERGAESRGESA